jgi:chromosome segregation ATPase
MRVFLRAVVLYGCVLLLLFVGGCASTDPREGGLIGGVQGISTGEYEDRVEERKERLQRLKEIQQELDENQAALEAEKEAKAVEIGEQQRQLDELDKKTEALGADIDRFEAGLGEEAAKKEELRESLTKLQNEIDSLSEESAKGIEVEQLEAERSALEEEYRLLLDLYRELSQ